MKRENYLRRGLLAAIAASIALTMATPAFAQDEKPPTRTPRVRATPTQESVAEDDRRYIEDDQTVSGGSYTLESDETLNGDLNVFGGSAETKAGSSIKGDVNVFGGSVDIAGEVKGNINVVGGSVEIKSTGRVEGKVSTLGGSVKREPGAYIRRGTSQINGPIPPLPPFANNWPRTRWDWNFDNWDGGNWNERGWGWFGDLFGVVLITLIAIVIAHFMPVQTARMVETLRTEAALAGGVGFLTFIVVPIGLIITLIGILALPVALVALLAGMLIGWTAIARIAGAWLMRGFGKQDWTLAGQTAAGAVLLALLGSAPIIGWLFSIVAACVGLGVVVLTRLGTQLYKHNRTSVQVYVPPMPPPPPQGPTSM